MEIEHFALNVPDPRAMADWYVRHCGMRVAFALEQAPYTRFLAGKPGNAMIEIYHNPADPLPDYTRQHHLRFHVAFSVSDPLAERRRLEAAGATFVEEVKLPDQTHVITLRDPWGVPLQLCRRGNPIK